MQIVILLTLVIIVGLLLKKEKKTSVRVIVGSIFGIIFLSIWPFIVFYIEVHNLGESYSLFYLVFISIFAIIISYLLVRIKHDLFIATFNFLSFSIITIYSLSFESSIKNKISIYTGYFKSSNTAPNTVSIANLVLKQRKTISTHNYFLSLDNRWRKITNKGTLFEYFHFFKEGGNIAEFRPKCFSTNTISLPETIKNAKYIANVNNMKIVSSCYKIDGFNFACKVSSLNKSKQKRRVRWFSFNTESNYGIELDFIIFKDESSASKEIEKVISSAITKGETNNKKPDCLGLTEWM